MSYEPLPASRWFSFRGLKLPKNKSHKVRKNNLNMFGQCAIYKGSQKQIQTNTIMSANLTVSEYAEKLARMYGKYLTVRNKLGSRQWVKVADLLAAGMGGEILTENANEPEGEMWDDVSEAPKYHLAGKTHEEIFG
ncbi:MAG: hypothetical protein IPK22_11430 [Verrucomicrobiaceae bacterium]|nr:hypothetical protein [Verrucomicrobiaceae bacterium]